MQFHLFENECKSDSLWLPEGVWRGKEERRRLHSPVRSFIRVGILSGLKWDGRKKQTWYWGHYCASTVWWEEASDLSLGLNMGRKADLKFTEVSWLVKVTERALIWRNEVTDPKVHVTLLSGANSRRTSLTKLLLLLLAPLHLHPKSQHPPLPLTLIKTQVLLLLPSCSMMCWDSWDWSRTLGTAPTKAWREASPSQPDLDGLGIEPWCVMIEAGCVVEEFQKQAGFLLAKAKGMHSGLRQVWFMSTEDFVSTSRIWCKEGTL